LGNDPIIATAILDRLLHHSTTIKIRGESYRLRERKKAGLLPTAGQRRVELADTSGTRGPRGKAVRLRLPVG
jgi:hypothetical protein